MALSNEVVNLFERFNEHQDTFGRVEVQLHSLGHYSASLSRLVEHRDGFFRHSVTGLGESAEAAMNNLWSNMTDTSGVVCVVIDGHDYNYLWDEDNQRFEGLNY